MPPHPKLNPWQTQIHGIVHALPVAPPLTKAQRAAANNQRIQEALAHRDYLVKKIHRWLAKRNTSATTPEIAEQFGLTGSYAREVLNAMVRDCLLNRARIGTKATAPLAWSIRRPV